MMGDIQKKKNGDSAAKSIPARLKAKPETKWTDERRRRR
jgi:hypothetical protein